LDSHVRPGSADYVGSYPQTKETSGSFEAWRNAIVDLAIDSPVFTTVLSFAVGSYCRGIPDIPANHSAIIHLHSTDSSIGKSFTQECCASLQTYPHFKGNVFADASSTLAATEIFLAANNHGVMCLDEIHSLLAKDNRPVERLMVYANGGGRGRVAVRNGSRALESGTEWNATIITSGNCGLESVYLNHPQAPAIRARIIEIDACQTPIFGFTDFDRINAARAVLLENYGHAYPLIIEYISQNRAKVIAWVQEFKDIAKNIAGDAMSGKLSRRVESCGLAYAGAHILSEILGIIIPTDNIVSLFSSEVQLAEEGAEHAKQTARDSLLGLICTSLGTFTVNGHLAIEDSDTTDEDNSGVIHNITTRQKDRAAAHSNRVTQRTTSNGVIVQKTPMKAPLDFSECQIFISTHGKDSLRNFDVVALAYQASEQGWLIRNGARKGMNSDQKQKGGVTMTKDGLGRCYAFDLGKATSLIKESERLDNLGHNDDPWPDIPF
jgi:hypothetical protein